MSRATLPLTILAVTLLACSTLHAGATVAPVVKRVFPALGAAAPTSLPPLPGGQKASGSGQLTWHGGPVQRAPRVYLVFWGWHGVDPNGEAPYLVNFFNGVGGSAWMATQGQYYDSWGHITNPTGQLAGVWFDDTSPLPPDPDMGVPDSGLGIEAEANAAAAHFRDVAPSTPRVGGNTTMDFYDFGDNVQYIIATPTGHSTAGFAANGGPYCAWHSDTGLNGEPGDFAYTNLPYQTDAGASCGQSFVNAGSAGTLDGVGIVAGHEYAETVTDPSLNAWYDAAGFENADKCAWNSGAGDRAGNIVLSTGTFAVQSLWSDAAGLCKMS